MSNGLRLEYVSESENSRKFWMPRVENRKLMVVFGRIGTAGQSHKKTFPSQKRAEQEYRKLVCEKLAKGYKPSVASRRVFTDSAKNVSNPMVVCTEELSAGICKEVLNDICAWLTACAHHRMSWKQFWKVIEKFNDVNNDDFIETFGKIHAKISDDESEYWEDNISIACLCMYRDAMKGGADRFVWVNIDGEYALIALKGDPGLKAVRLAYFEGK